VPWRLNPQPERPYRPRVGDVWYAHGMVAPENQHFFVQNVLSLEYLTTWFPHRAPLFVHLPDGRDFCLDAARMRAGKKVDGHGWHVSGLMPFWTASPILESAGYAGYLFDGVLGPDEFGRHYPLAGEDG
jgi:hypothetical protein